MKFHWTGQNYGEAVDFFVEIEGCIGVIFDDGVLIARVGDKSLHFPAGTDVEFVESE